MLLVNTLPTDPPTWEWSRGALRERGPSECDKKKKKSAIQFEAKALCVYTVQSRPGRGSVYISEGMTSEPIDQVEQRVWH